MVFCMGRTADLSKLFGSEEFSTVRTLTFRAKGLRMAEPWETDDSGSGSSSGRRI
jgi:hypothetical protein